MKLWHKKVDVHIKFAQGIQHSYNFPLIPPEYVYCYVLFVSPDDADRLFLRSVLSL